MKMHTVNNMLYVSILTIAFSLGALLAFVGDVMAFPYTYSWHDSPTSTSPGPKPGAGGVYGTGGASDLGIHCAHCHVKGEGKITVAVTSSPAWSKVGNANAYQPDRTYAITVTMMGEHRRGATTNLNGMNATIEDANGKPVGVFIASSGARSDACSQTRPANDIGATTHVYGDCHGVVFGGATQDRTSWTFQWVAPAAGSGAVTIFYGVVDGDSGGNSSLDDDVKVGTVKLEEM